MRMRDERARAALVGTAQKYQEAMALLQRRRINREKSQARREVAKAKKSQLITMLEVGLRSLEISADQLALFGL